MKRYQTLFLEDICVDERVKMRVNFSPKVVAEYAAAMGEGEMFPPMVVYCDSQRYWLADGFHRFEAHQIKKTGEVYCEVRQGGFRDALLYACGANACHGLRRTNADKRKAVTTVLQDEEWSKWSDREIACICGVGHSFVSEIRAELSVHGGQINQQVRTVVRGNSEYQMDTSRIGKLAPREDPQATREVSVGRPSQAVFSNRTEEPSREKTAWEGRPTEPSQAVFSNRTEEPSQEKTAWEGRPTETSRGAEEYPKPMRDGKRHPVPEGLRPVFTTARQIRGCSRMLDRSLAILGKAATLPGGEHLSKDMLSRLDLLCELVRGATPYIVCPAYNTIAHTHCKLCGVEEGKARGYIARWDYVAPASSKQARLKAAAMELLLG